MSSRNVIGGEALAEYSEGNLRLYSGDCERFSDNMRAYNCAPIEVTPFCKSIILTKIYKLFTTLKFYTNYAIFNNISRTVCDILIC